MGTGFSQTLISTVSAKATFGLLFAFLGE